MTPGNCFGSSYDFESVWSEKVKWKQRVKYSQKVNVLSDLKRSIWHTLSLTPHPFKLDISGSHTLFKKPFGLNLNICRFSLVLRQIRGFCSKWSFLPLIQENQGI